MVGVAGFEPATPRPPGVCATGLRHTPFHLWIGRIIRAVQGCKQGMLPDQSGMWTLIRGPRFLKLIPLLPQGLQSL